MNKQTVGHMRQLFLRGIATVLLCAVLLPSSLTAMKTASNYHLAGLALHLETGRDIYLGAIYLEQEPSRAVELANNPGPRMMEYRVVARRTSMRSLLGSMLLQSEVATGTAPDTATVEFADHILSAVHGSLYAGDRFEILLDARGETTAFLNGLELARVDTRAVADYLLMGWIGASGPSSAFRSSIMAGKINTSLLALLKDNNYSQERAAEIASWLKEPAEPATEVAAETASVGVTAAPLAEPAQAAPPPQETIVQVIDPTESVAAAEPVQVASLAPSPELLQPAVEDSIKALDIKEYSKRLSNFHSGLVAMVYGQVQYPRRAVRRGIQGRLELDITLLENGELVEVAVVQSSGYKLLDNAARDAAQSAFASGKLETIDPVAIEEFSPGQDGKLVIPVPVSFMLQN
jgi:protein TonB